MVHQVVGNRVSIAEYKEGLHVPRDFSKESVLSQDGTATEEMSCFVAHIAPSACGSWLGSIMPLEVGLTADFQSPEVHDGKSSAWSWTFEGFAPSW